MNTTLFLTRTQYDALLKYHPGFIGELIAASSRREWIIGGCYYYNLPHALRYLAVRRLLALAGVPVANPLSLGCTAYTHARLGIHAVVNARGGQQWRNDDTQEQVEMQRDARAIRDRIRFRTRFYQFNSRTFRRHQARLSHLLADRNED